MKLNDLGEPFFSSNDLIREIYQGNFDKLSSIKMDPTDNDYQKYVLFVDKNKLEDWPLPEPFITTEKSVKEFDHENQMQWFMPKEYIEFNIIEHLYSLCKTNREAERVLEELDLFVKHDMIELLKFLRYLVDIMRQNNILWGVGRGSSVASYCLYLLGVHKVDSLKYDLDIREFLK